MLRPRRASDAPADGPERTFLLFCPEQGGWQTGVHFEGRWRDFATLTKVLEPNACAVSYGKAVVWSVVRCERGHLPKNAA